MDSIQRIKNYSFDVQLFTVLLLLFFLSALLGQKIILFQTMTYPLLSLLGCLFIWVQVKAQNNVRKSIGISIIVILLCGTIFQGLPISQEVATLASYPFFFLLLWEFTQVARKDTKFLVGWLIIIPLGVLSAGEVVSPENLGWIFLLSFPVFWSFMSLYANAQVFKKAIIYVGLIQVTLLVLIYLVIDIISLGFIKQLMEEPYFKELFGSSQTVPILHLIFSVYFIPSIITSIICYFIADRRISNTK